MIMAKLPVSAPLFYEVSLILLSHQTLFASGPQSAFPAEVTGQLLADTRTRWLLGHSVKRPDRWVLWRVPGRLQPSRRVLLLEPWCTPMASGRFAVLWTASVHVDDKLGFPPHD